MGTRSQIVPKTVKKHLLDAKCERKNAYFIEFSDIV